MIRYTSFYEELGCSVAGVGSESTLVETITDTKEADSYELVASPQVIRLHHITVILPKVDFEDAAGAR